MASLRGNRIHNGRLALVLTLSGWVHEWALAQWCCECVDTWSAAATCFNLLHVARVGHLEEIAQSDELILIHFHLLIHLVEFRILDILLRLCQVLILPAKLALELLDLFL